MPHPPLVAARRIRPSRSPWRPSHLWPIFWHLSMIFLHLSTIFRHLSTAVRLLCARYPPPTLSLVDALFTYGHAIAHRQVNIASIRLGGEESARLYSCRRCGPFAVVYGPVQGNGLESRTNSCSHTRAYAGPGTRSQHGRNEKPPGHINCGQATSNKLIGRP